MSYKDIKHFVKSFFDGMLPDPDYTVSEWADNNRYLDQKSSSEPGKWRTDRTPYLRAIMDSLSVNNPTSEVVFVKGAQIGGTEAGNNWIGYTIDIAPGPLMAVATSLDVAKRNSTSRLDPMIDSCPTLAKKVPRGRDKRNSLLKKEYPGGMLVLVGSNSPANLRSMPARYLFLDEVDAYETNLGGEGDPIALAIARTRTYSSRRKVFMVSTPTVEQTSRIWKAFLTSNQQYYMVPCPHCKTKQRLIWSNIRYPEDKPHDVVYMCQSCGVGIEEHYKEVMLANGEWVASNPGSPIDGYHLSSLYSPLGWYSWKEAAIEYEASKNDPFMLQVFTNTVLGEPWRVRGESPEWQPLYDRRVKHERGVVPNGALVLTAAVDVQGNRIEVEILGVGENFESWLIDYIVIPGDPFSAKPFEELDRIMEKQYLCEDGTLTTIRRLGIDSGYATHEVYDWARKYGSDRVIVTKGVDTLNSLVSTPKSVDIKKNGKLVKRGITLWNMNPSIAKQQIYGWLKQQNVTDEKPKGWCNFPEWAEQSYFKMLCAEQLTFKTVGGMPKMVWEKIQDRNEVLDTRVINRVVWYTLGIDRWREQDWENIRRKREKAVVVNKPQQQPEQPKTVNRQPSAIKMKKSDYWG